MEDLCPECGERFLTTPEEQGWGECRVCKFSAGAAGGWCWVCGFAVEKPQTDVCSRCQQRYELPAVIGDPRAMPPCRFCSGDTWIRSLFRSAGGGRSGLEAFPLVPVAGGGRGIFELYVCRDCGSCQWFILNPETIPVGARRGTRLVSHRTGPYRG
jgi:hypothetical protein